MYRKLLLTLSLAAAVAAQAQQMDSTAYRLLKEQIKSELRQEAAAASPAAKPRLQLGGYGEAVYSYNFYSDHFRRYSKAQDHKDDKGHGRFDLPHVVIWLGYDFGKGWSLGTEIEFEHGGTESAVEMEAEEAGEYEAEVERGGEVALEQFWIEKSFCKELNLRIGHMVVPVGATNNAHMPTEFFGVYRPQGENTILPCTWHETGIGLWGRAGDWRYEAMLIPGLDSDRFGLEGWIHDGAGSPYEFKIGNAVACAARVDNHSVRGLRLSASGYVGNSFVNSLGANNPIYTNSGKNNFAGVKGTVGIGSFDFLYKSPRKNFVARGSFTYGHLSNSAEISTYNNGMRLDSPSPHQNVASDALATGFEAGYNLLALGQKKESEQKLYLFGRYDYYDSMYKTASSITAQEWCGRNRVAVGLNYYPLSKIVLKAEYSLGILKEQYNNEPALSVGIAYSGLFTK